MTMQIHNSVIICAPVYTTHNNVIVNCRVPDEPMSGTILDYDNIVTIEGSEITFQCNPGLSPEGEMTATCTNAGIWSPDPAGVTCMNITGKLIFYFWYIYIIHDLYQVNWVQTVPLVCFAYPYYTV